MKALWLTIKNNWLLICVVMVFLLINNSFIIAGIGRSMSDNNFTYSGAPTMNAADYFVYQSDIVQGAQGHLFVKNLFNYQSGAGTFLSPHWWLMGQINNLTKIDLIISYQLIRLLLTIILTAIAWIFIRKIFNYKQSLVAITILLFANGLGTVFMGLFPHSSLVPADFWIPETTTFLTATQGPLLILSQVLIWTTLLLFIKNSLEFKYKRWLYLSLCFGFLALIHPFDIVIVIALCSVWSIFEFWSTKNKKMLPNLLGIYLIAGLGYIYFTWVLQTDPANRQYQAQNVLLSENILEYVWGLGLLALSSVVGLVYALKIGILKNPYLKMAFIWAIVGWVLLYLPLDFNRRLGNGWHLSLVIISMPLLITIYQKLKSWKKIVTVALMIVLFCFDTLTIVSYNYQTVYNNEQQYFLLEKTQPDVYKYIRNNAPEDSVFLSSYRDGLFLPAFTGRRTYVGHIINTWEVEAKAQEVEDLWSAQGDIKNWLKDKHINYIFASRLLSPQFDKIKLLAKADYIEPVIDNDQYILYHVK